MKHLTLDQQPLSTDWIRFAGSEIKNEDGVNPLCLSINSDNDTNENQISCFQLSFNVG